MYEIQLKEDFIKESLKIDPKLKKRIHNFIYKILPEANNPINLFEKMTGYKVYYKKRFGDYRLGVEINQSAKSIVVLTIMHRKEIYRYFPPR
jgi:mRNA interferase RelE/StbE